MHRAQPPKLSTLSPLLDPHKAFKTRKRYLKKMHTLNPIKRPGRKKNKTPGSLVVDLRHQLLRRILLGWLGFVASISEILGGLGVYDITGPLV